MQSVPLLGRVQIEAELAQMRLSAFPNILKSIPGLWKGVVTVLWDISSGRVVSANWPASFA